MKNIQLAGLISLVMFSMTASGQDSLQFARLKSLQGKTAPFSFFARKDSLFVICFWSVESEESITELNSINANLERWQNQVPFRFMAVSADEGRTTSRFRPTYNMNGWTFEAYDDLYGDMRRALHSNNIPQSVIIFNGVIIYEQSGWTPGTEKYLIDRLLTLKH
jgi:hypothetical protein